MKRAIILASLLISATFISCDKEEGDTTKPVIDLVSPASGENLSADGTGMHFEMELSDNDELSSYKVEIHNAFDGHTHASKSSETVDFEYTNTWDISGLRNTSIHHHEIIIPTDATPGDYHFMVYCIDASGNESYVARSITIGME